MQNVDVFFRLILNSTALDRTYVLFLISIRNNKEKSGLAGFYVTHKLISGNLLQQQQVIIFRHF